MIISQKIQLCFGTFCDFQGVRDSHLCEALYQTVYKPLVSFLYNAPDFPFTLAFSGFFMCWIEKNHPEFFMILDEMTTRKQIEVLGNGYWSPIFPLIPPADRVGQIELMTTHLRKNVGKRPRGLWIPMNAWDQSLITSFNSCGIEYVLLDKALFPQKSGESGRRAPIIVEDCGKTLCAIPFQDSSLQDGIESAETFINALKSSTGDPSSVIVTFFDTPSLSAYLTSNNGNKTWFERFYDALNAQKNEIECVIPGKIAKSQALWERSFIDAGIFPENQKNALSSAKNEILRSPTVFNLYAKMMYVHVLVNQLRGDKARKKNAREELWKAQQGSFYVPSAEYPAVSLSTAYRHLLTAEKATRIRGVFSPTIVSFDFDFDGLKEFLCQLEHINIYVHQRGGKIFEYDVLKTNKNFCAVEGPRHGLFIDHFVSRDETDPESFLTSPDIRHSKLQTSHYQDISIDPARHEILLKTQALSGLCQQPITLKKQYSFRNEGMQVQYILKNESPLGLSGYFLTEFNLSISGSRSNQPYMEIYSGENRHNGPVTTSRYPDVSWIRLDDADSKTRFTIEANENPAVSLFTEDGIRFFLCWQVDLGPNFETEKTVFFKSES